MQPKRWVLFVKGIIKVLNSCFKKDIEKITTIDQAIYIQKTSAVLQNSSFGACDIHVQNFNSHLRLLIGLSNLTWDAWRQTSLLKNQFWNNLEEMSYVMYSIWLVHVSSISMMNQSIRELSNQKSLWDTLKFTAFETRSLQGKETAEEAKPKIDKATKEASQKAKASKQW